MDQFVARFDGRRFALDVSDDEEISGTSLRISDSSMVTRSCASLRRGSHQVRDAVPHATAEKILNADVMHVKL